MNISSKSEIELLRLYSEILKVLKEKGVIRTNNAPLADYAEWLVQEHLDMVLENNSKTGYDAMDKAGLKYQIKCRRVHKENNSRQLGVIRKYDNREFDYLIGIIFNEDFSIDYAYKIPHELIKDYSRYSEHQNGHILQLNGKILDDPKSINITELFKVNK